MDRLGKTNAKIKQSFSFVRGKKKSLSVSKHQTKLPIRRVLRYLSTKLNREPLSVMKTWP